MTIKIQHVTVLEIRGDTKASGGRSINITMSFNTSPACYQEIHPDFSLFYFKVGFRVLFCFLVHFKPLKSSHIIH